MLHVLGSDTCTAGPRGGVAGSNGAQPGGTLPRGSVLGAALGLALLSACVPTAIRRDSTAAVDPSRREEAISRAIVVLQGRGFVVALVDRAEGLVTSLPRLTAGVPYGIGGLSGSGRARDVVQVTVARDGRVRVTLVREIREDNGPRPAFTEYEVAGVEAEQDDLLAEVTGLPIAHRALLVPATAAPARPGLRCPASSKLTQAWLREESTLHGGPEPEAEALRALAKGTPVCATDWRAGGRRQVRLEDNREGWLSEAALELAAPVPPGG